MSIRLLKWFNSGDPWVWLCAGTVALSLIMVAGLILLLTVRGLGYFWPADLTQVDYRGMTLIGEYMEREEVPAEQYRDQGIEIPEEQTVVGRRLIKTGNRDISGTDFIWVIENDLERESHPLDLMVLERREWGNFYGFLANVKEDGKIVADGNAAWAELDTRLTRALDLFWDIRTIEKDEIGAINYKLERLRLNQRELELRNDLDENTKATSETKKIALNKQYDILQARLQVMYQKIRRDSLTAKTSQGQEVEVPIFKVVRAYQPNRMGLHDKMSTYLHKLWEYVSDEPREANTEGGVFPAIYGTVLMVLLMTFLVTPFGVVAAVYLREYAKQGIVTRLIRIAVNNLAGVPSIVYGVFGLGFFVYFLGGNIDRLFFPEALPGPTFGTPGLLWASLTLALLTVPVVIVATEEGLSRIPKAIREGSLALGATKAETLWRTVLPMASPAIMTGMILAIARAAGEVAPLMLVGVVKLAPSLPLDGNLPFLHLDRKFMHLGFHIYDVGFQSPNVEAARPLVFATALLLVIVIVLLNIAAIAIRNRLREQHRALDM